MSFNGRVAAIYSTLFDSDRGRVRVYSWDGSRWVQRGADLPGQARASLDGDLIAMFDLARPCPNILVYSWDGSSWVQRGSIIEDDSCGQTVGSVWLSSDGSLLARADP